MDDEEYLDSLMSKATTEVTHTWVDCVDGFKQADVDMGSAFHRKLGWMNKAADIYLLDNNKMAGFVGRFAEDCGISYDYSSRINRLRNSPYMAKNFSANVMEALLSAPEELREDIVSSGKPVTAEEVKEAKTHYSDVQTKPEFEDVKEELDSGTITPFEASERVKERKASMPVVPKYNVDEAMGAIKGISQMYGQQYEGTTTEASQVLLNRIMEGYDQDDVGLSIARDYAKWFLSLKEVFDLVGPELEEFLADKPNLSIVN